MRTRDDRRNFAALAKRDARDKLLRSGMEPTPRRIGAQASMHNTCPCWMCTNKEPQYERKTLRDMMRLHEV
jgi:hypothetical protein